MRVRVLTLIGLCVLLSGCAQTSLLAGTTPHAKAKTAPVYTLPKHLTIPTPKATGIQPSATSLKIIQSWSSDLREGHVDAAARLFAFPSAFINPPEAVKILNLQQSQAVNASLPCGATLVSADQRGKYVNALFRLGGRKGPGATRCSGTARTNFLISRGKILEWIRAPSEPGDQGRADGQQTEPTSTLSQVPVV